MRDEAALESSESMQSVQGTFPGRHHVEQTGEWRVRGSKDFSSP